MTEPPHQMSELRSLARSAASSLASSSRMLAKRSLVEVVQSGSQPLLLMPGAQFTFRIYFYHTKSGGFLWFRRKSVEERSLIEANIAFAVLPISPQFPSGSTTLESLRIDALLPGFLKLSSSETVPSSWRSSDALAFDLGKRRMVVRIQKSETPSERDIRFFEEDGTEFAMKVGGKWRLAPFLLFLDAFEDWLADPFGRSQRFELKDLAERLERNDFGRLAKVSLETVFSALNGATESEKAVVGTSVFGDLIANYTVDEATIQLVVMLEADGTLPELRDKEIYQMKVEINLAELASKPVGTALLFPPDFVVSGDLREAFLDLLKSQDFWSDSSVVSAFGNGLGAGGIRSLLRSSDTRISIFRTKRRKRAQGFDTDLIVVRNAKWLFLIEGKFRQVSDGSGFEFDPGSAKRIVATSLLKIGYHLDDRTVRYFYRLMRALRRWIDLME